MAVYSLGRVGGVGTNAVASAEIRTAASLRLVIREIGVFLTAATVSRIGLGRPAAIGVTPTTPVLLQAEDTASPAALSSTAIAWGTAPTVPTQFLRVVDLPATVGAGVIWTFPQGLIVPVSSGLVLWNMTTSGVISFYVVADE